MSGIVYPKRIQLRWRWDGEANDFITYHNPYTGTISILNPVAAEIFKLCDGNNPVSKIIESIQQEFNAPDIDTVTRDVTEFLEYMGKIGAVFMLSEEE